MEAGANAGDRSSPSPPAAAAYTCRVAIIGGQRQRVAKVTALLRSSSDEQSLGQTTNVASSSVEIEHLPCVATFDSYEDERGATVRYLAKLEYHGPNGTLLKGKSLAPFFDREHVDASSEVGDDDGDGNDKENPFPGISAAAVGCGIEDEGDVDRIRSFLETLSSSCAAQLSSERVGGDDGDRKMAVECIRPNPEYSSMKEENDAFRDLSQEGKKEAVVNGTIGPGKMARFVREVAESAIRRILDEGLTADTDELKQQQSSSSAEDTQTPSPNDETPADQSESHAPESEPALVPDEVIQSVDEQHVPNPEKTRYACRRCRTVLFGEEDLEDPPHAPSQHDFRRRGKKAYLAGPCQNHCLAAPLPWMDDGGCGEMEGKLHCPKCETKVGSYSWTGAQCSCGTWVTPAIMIPLGRVDQMRPISENVISATGALFVRQMGPAIVGANDDPRMKRLMGGMTIAGEGASSLRNGSNA